MKNIEMDSMIVFCDIDKKVIEEFSTLKKWKLESADSDLGGFEYKLTNETYELFLHEKTKQPNIIIISGNECSNLKTTSLALRSLSDELHKFKIRNYLFNIESQ